MLLKALEMIFLSWYKKKSSDRTQLIFDIKAPMPSPQIWGFSRYNLVTDFTQAMPDVLRE